MWEQSDQWSGDSGIGILNRPWPRRPWNHGSIPDTGSEFSLFSKLSQTGSEDHPASYSVGTAVLSSRVKMPGREIGPLNWTTYLPPVLGLGITWAIPPLSHRLNDVQMDILVQRSESEGWLPSVPQKRPSLTTNAVCRPLMSYFA
jgi:hypothetical protein